MREGRLGYNSYNKRYGLLSSDLWIDTGFHCGECLEVLLDDEWVQTRMEMNPAREGAYGKLRLDGEVAVNLIVVKKGERFDEAGKIRI